MSRDDTFMNGLLAVILLIAALVLLVGGGLVGYCVGISK